MSDNTIGPQLSRAADGTDPRGCLVFEWLPDDVQRQEDSTQAADFDRCPVGGFDRPATQAERTLLAHLGYELPETLTTRVSFTTNSVRNRRWPTLEGNTTP